MKRRTMMMASTSMAAGAADLLAGMRFPAKGDEAALIELPIPRSIGAAPLEQVVAQRRSVRSYATQPLPLAAISQLLWAAQGITGAGGLRTAPSAGALYPLELHVAAARVEGLARGVYRYVPPSHRLRRVAGDSALPALARAALSQQCVAAAPVVFVVAAVEERTARKYGTRASRYVALEAGAALQNLALQAVAQGLGSVVIGAFDDAAVARALGLVAGEQPLALMPTGRPLT